MNVIMRTLERDDASAIAELMSAHPLWERRDQAKQARSIASSIDRGEYGLVAERTEESERVLAGFVIMSDGTFGEYGYIRLIGAERQVTGRGIGARLLLEAERVFVGRGIERVFLLCTESNAGARSFYERHGYVQVGTLPDWLQRGRSELIYVKRDLTV